MRTIFAFSWPFVNVVLLSLPDSAFVQGGMTDEQGVFKIVTNIDRGLFKVTSVGYQTLYTKAGNDLTIQGADTLFQTGRGGQSRLPRLNIYKKVGRKRISSETFSYLCSGFLNVYDYGKVLRPESRPDFQEGIRRAP